MIILGLAVAGAFGGAIVGPLFGIERVSRYDDNVAGSMQLGPESAAVVVRARIPPTGASEGARDLLERAGAVALLDMPTYQAGVRRTTDATVVESTSAGDGAAAPRAAPFGRSLVGQRSGVATSGINKAIRQPHNSARHVDHPRSRQLRRFSPRRMSTWRTGMGLCGHALQRRTGEVCI